MTLAPNTIERQLDELKNQYQHACNLISSLTELGHNQRQMIERRDQRIVELQCKLTAANSPVGECKCGGECPNG